MTIRARRAATDHCSDLVDFNPAMARESEGKAPDPVALERGVRHVLDNPGDGYKVCVRRSEPIAPAR